MSTENGELRRRLGLKHAVKVRKNDRFSKSDRALLKDYNLDEKEVSKYCSSVDFECMNRCFHVLSRHWHQESAQWSGVFQR